KAELLAGVVYVAEPVAQPHGEAHVLLSSAFAAYQASTPGVQVCDNATVILGDEDEVQPDLFLRILPACQGRSRDTAKGAGAGKGPYVAGPPELIAEVALSSRSIDLHLKRQRYERSGVVEYLVVCLQPAQIRWFVFPCAGELSPDEGVFRSRAFPGLWVHADALLNSDYHKVMRVLNEGLSAPEHAEFVARLAAARKS
ncbi:MAG TPA: Uma2 family endonuclease, partial [Candidatus Obscuribacterales bacterium]